MSENLIRCLLKLKKYLLITICLSVFVSISGCMTTTPERETRTLLDLVHYFDSVGLKPNKIQPTRYQTLRASNGCALHIQGAKVEVYIYDIADKKQRKKLAKICKNHRIQVLALQIPVVVNGGMVMLTYSKHPNKAKIVRAFKKFPLDYHK